MQTIKSKAPQPIFVPALEKVLEPEMAYTISDAEFALVKNHPWIEAMASASTPTTDMARPNAPQTSESEI